MAWQPSSCGPPYRSHRQSPISVILGIANVPGTAGVLGVGRIGDLSATIDNQWGLVAEHGLN